MWWLRWALSVTNHHKPIKTVGWPACCCCSRSRGGRKVLYTGKAAAKPGHHMVHYSLYYHYFLGLLYLCISKNVLILLVVLPSIFYVQSATRFPRHTGDIWYLRLVIFLLEQVILHEWDEFLSFLWQHMVTECFAFRYTHSGPIIFCSWETVS